MSEHIICINERNPDRVAITRSIQIKQLHGYSFGCAYVGVIYTIDKTDKLVLNCDPHYAMLRDIDTKLNLVRSHRAKSVELRSLKYAVSNTTGELELFLKSIDTISIRTKSSSLAYTFLRRL